MADASKPTPQRAVKRAATTRAMKRQQSNAARHSLTAHAFTTLAPRHGGAEITLPQPFVDWFQSRGWAPRPHQLALVANWQAKRSTLLIAPTGAGKTLAGFLPSLVDLTAERAISPRGTGSATVEGGSGLHTLYISPLKALAVDVTRNLSDPIAEMGLPITAEARTGDTPVSRRQRQRERPPDILLTTPEQLALMLCHDSAPHVFGGVKTVILDELHALVTSKRGDLLSLDLAWLRRLAPAARFVGLSATVAQPSALRAYLVPQKGEEFDPDTGEVMPAATSMGDLVLVRGGAEPDIRILESAERLPWAGHSARYAYPEVYEAIKAHKLVLLFVNTRSQAEMLFHALWQLNEDTLPIALHHGSLEVGQRRKVEAAMAAGKLRAVVCTSTLDLGIDWGDVDLVVHVGAPKGSSRLAQRIGRANHRMDEPSKALLVPANRFEVLECRAALEAAKAGHQDTVMNRVGALDVLAQHVLGLASAGPLDADAAFAEVRTALPYRDLTRAQFDRVLDFVATGGYALRAYDRFARLVEGTDGLWRIANKRHAQQYRLNIGTIVDNPMLKVRLGRPRANTAALGSPGGPGSQRALAGGRVLGEIDEWYTTQLVPGDTFVFAGQVLRFEGMRETDVFVSPASDADPKIPSYQGGKFPLSTSLADRVRCMLADSTAWPSLPDQVGEWLSLQEKKSVMPGPDEILVETFPRGNRHYFLCYPFEGRLAHQTLGVLLTRRLERARARPLGFVANDYAVAVWCLNDLNAMAAQGRLDFATIFDVDMLGDDLDEWLAQSSIMKRTFHMCAVISGLIERRHPGQEKTGRQVVMSTDLIFDVLRRHQPDHMLLEAAWADAATGLLDLGRLSDFLTRVEGRIRHMSLASISPMAVPVMLEAGREAVYGEARDGLLAEAAEELIAEAMGPPLTPGRPSDHIMGAADRLLNGALSGDDLAPIPAPLAMPAKSARSKPRRRRERPDGKPAGRGGSGRSGGRAGGSRQQ